MTLPKLPKKSPPKLLTKPVPLISVIIPVYNVESTLERCLDSVLHQTYKNLEIILVNDGSTDRSGELCDELAQKHHQNGQHLQIPKKTITVIHQKNQGLSAARNTGLAAMHGSYVTFVDSDDFLDETMIAQLYQALFLGSPAISTSQPVSSLKAPGSHHTQKSQASPLAPPEPPLKLSICSFAETFPDGSERSFVKFYHANPEQKSTTILLDQETCLIDMLCEHDFTLMACGKLYAAELFDSVRYPVGKLYEDVGTTYQLILQCPEIAFLPAPLYKYYQNPASIIHQTFRPQKLDLITLTDAMCDNIAKAYHHPDDNPKNLESALKLRRMHARFSVLRQVSLSKPSTLAEKSQFQQIQRETIAYLKKHKNDVLKNPYSTPRDLLAMQALRLGLPVFTLAWRLYSRLRS